MKIHETVEAAIQTAKSRAKTRYQTQYVFPIEGGFCVRSQSPIRAQRAGDHAPVAKVTYGGEITTYPERKEAH